MRTRNNNGDASRQLKKRSSSRSSEQPPFKIVIVARPQTLDEQRRFKAATDALLTELVRQQLGRRN